MNLGDTEKQDFQAYLDSLDDGYGVEQLIEFVPSGPSIRVYPAGIRVLKCTPIFNRETGEIDSWRYLLMFVEAGALDVLHAGNPVHVFECRVLERKGHVLRLEELGGSLRFMICRNDPHSLSDRQAAFYQHFDEQVASIGGPNALKTLLDQVAVTEHEEHERFEKGKSHAG